MARKFGFRMLVTLDDDSEQEVTTGVADLLALEEKHGVEPEAFFQARRLEWLVFLAWSALSRKGHDVGDWDTFKGRVEDLEIDIGEAVAASPNGNGAGDSGEATAAAEVAVSPV